MIPDYLKLTNEDNMELMKRYPENYFDLAIVDPPYGIDILHSGGLGTVCKNKKHNRKMHERKQWDKTPPDLKYFKELFRVSKNQIIWGGNYFTPYLPPSMGWIFWDKGQDLSMSDGELAFSSFDKALRRKVINRGQLMVEGGTIHPTQKPVKLYEWLLVNYAKQGNKILDTHLGSGSIAVAVDNVNKLEKMELELTACELDTDYFSKSIKRVMQQTRQLTLI